ncbi:MAG: anion permease [Treponema sp.]|jgi:anion transporter|nr:anion permease [Treponema sp.]
MTAAHGSTIVLLIVMICYFTNLLPVAVTAMGSCVVLAVLKLAPVSTVWSGLSSDTTLVVGGMIVVGTAIIETGAARTVGSFFVRKTKGNFWLAAFSLVVLALVLSGFMNNSATVATMLPVMLGVVVASNGKLNEKHWLMPLAVATNTGGMLTMLGTTSQMIIQNSLAGLNMPPFGFFEFAWIGVPVCIAFIFYFLLFGSKLNRWIWPRPAEHTAMVQRLLDKGNNNDAEKKTGDPRAAPSASLLKQGLSVLIMLAAITWMVSPSSIPNGTVAAAAAVMVLVTKCISLKELYKKFDWTTVFVLAGGIGFANGMDKSGGGRLIADWIAGLFGTNIMPMQVFVMFVLTGALLTLFMSNTAVAAMLTPIAIAFTDIVDFNVYPVLMGICMATNCAFSTPIATPSMTLVLGPGEYKFNDYIKWCLPFNLFTIVLILLIVPLVWPLNG